ncbi:MAG: hypothetical protein RIR97_2099 [Pseudomonadota bacterium]
MTEVCHPQSEAEAAGLVRAHAQAGRPLALLGSNSRSGFGYGVAAPVLSSARLSGIVSYHPAELTMTVRSGTPLAEIEALLSDNGQTLAFEPCDHRAMMGTRGEPTIGGVFAANVSGPRRFVAGAARDHLLGIRFVNGMGDVVKSGGRVMKNVTGLDLVKVLTGSYGTLGFITELTVKLQAKAKAAATVVLSGLNDAEAAHAMAAAMRMSVEVSGAAHLPMSVAGRFLMNQLPSGPATVLRLEGLPESVAVRQQTLVDAMSTFGPVTRLDAMQTGVLWSEIRDVLPFTFALDKPLWRVSVAPMAGHQLLSALRLETGVDAYFDWQGGLLWLQMEAGAEADLVRRYIRHVGGGHATLIRASAKDRATTAPFEPQTPAIVALSQRIKSKFDPKGIFNPGRMGEVV